jgi:hypothetical protein
MLQCVNLMCFCYGNVIRIIFKVMELYMFDLK